MPAAMSVSQPAISTRSFVPLQNPRGLVQVSPKWTGRLRAAALAMANWACDRPCLGSFAVSCHVRAHRLVVTPQVCACPLAPTPRACAYPCSAFALACRRCLGFVLALSRQHLRRRLVHMLGLPSPGNISTSRSAMPCAQGTNASGLAAVAFSASPAGSTPAVPSARLVQRPQPAAPPLVRARQRPKVRLFLLPYPRPSMRAQDCQGLRGRHHGALMSRPMLTLPLISPGHLWQVGWFQGFGATGFGGVPLSGNTLSRWIIAHEGVMWRRNGGRGENNDEE